MNVEALAGAAPGAGEAFGVEEIGELLAASLLIHEVNDGKVHEVGSEEMKTNISARPGDQIRTWRKRANHLIGYMSLVLFGCEGRMADHGLGDLTGATSAAHTRTIR